jgi:hypothetical protein
LSNNLRNQRGGAEPGHDRADAEGRATDRSIDRRVAGHDRSGKTAARSERNQLAISPRQQKIATAIRYWRSNQRAHLSKRLNGDCGARQEKSSAGAKQNQQRIVQVCRSARDRQ